MDLGYLFGRGFLSFAKSEEFINLLSFLILKRRIYGVGIEIALHFIKLSSSIIDPLGNVPKILLVKVFQRLLKHFEFSNKLKH